MCKLFGPTKAIEDGQSNVEFLKMDSQQIPPTANVPSEPQIANNQEDIAAMKPEHITEEEWMIYMNHINSEEFQERLVHLRESTSLSEDEIFAEVLPSKLVAFQAIGVLPKQHKLRATQKVAALRKELEEYKVAMTQEMEIFSTKVDFGEALICKRSIFFDTFTFMLN
ncbi:hypothetical protein FNV43_RR08180 [Rhamnella rubrinervis]|uniref:Uncharacterized protein n=1 Tax=Rhamnella rubrinervis TaxID=2594499 RepID=A0A8K0HHZ9_9ROSA|nr:hypothetical protein FNV43_RR08180 [Rhamnella rubrinervis]